MKRYLSALLALALCLCAAAASAQDAAEPLPPAEPPVATEAPTKAPTEAPTKAPTEAPTEAPTQEPADPPEPELTEAPPTDAPEPEPTGEPGDATPDATEPPADEPEPTQGDPEPTQGPEDDGGAALEKLPAEDIAPEEREAEPEGYVNAGDGRVTGTLADLLAEPGEKTVYVLSKRPVEIADFRLALLRDVTLLPDPEAFAGKTFAVALYDGDAPIAPEDIAAATGETVRLVIAVEERPKEPAGPDGEPGEEGAIQIVVEAVNLREDGAWQREVPEFRLSGIPEGAQGYLYEAILYDERYVPLSGDAYLPTREGEFAVRFAIMNEMDDSVSVSDRYEFKLDYTPPELAIEVSETADYTMTLSGSDALSGVAEMTLDGGETWKQVELDDGLSVVHTESRRKVFKPGTIGLRDFAGNERWNEESVVLDAVPRGASSGFGGFGGYGGSGGASATAAPHASGDGDDAPYAAYALELPEGPVDALTLGGEPIDLGLELEEGSRPAVPGKFTAELTAWAKAGGAEAEAGAEPEKDTLVIRAEAADGGERACRWRINGAVLRKLYNTDIRYLALAVGDAMLCLPTVGFTAGTRYADLKMQGVSTAEFEYEIVMRTGSGAGSASAGYAWNRSPDCAVELWVEVAGERFAMVDRDETPEMYPFDVYCGPADLTDYPYGAYPGMEAEA